VSFPLAPGTLVRVPLGRREVLGVVWDEAGLDAGGAEPDMALKPVGAGARRLPPLGEAWRELVAFAANTTSAARARSRWPRCRRSCAT
jgi:primosomal protein N' (replication factor Y)